MYCESAFYCLFDAIRFYKQCDLTDLIKGLEDAVKKEHPIAFPLFVDAHYCEVEYVMKYVQSPILCLPLVCVTSIFDDFSKGVTYFRDQSYARQPTDGRLQGYHHIDCEEERRSRVAICYIEQQIFAGIMDYMGGDMEPYRKVFEETKIDFIRFYPALEIHIKIVWDPKLKLPYELLITRVSHGVWTSAETYKRELQGEKYTPVVECIRKTRGKTFFRVQRFDYTGKWYPI